MKKNPYKYHNFDELVIGRAVWLYSRFTLSLRDVSEIMYERGTVVSYESIRQWNLKFGQLYANEIKRRRAKRGDKWHLDEICVVKNKKKYWVWHAVDEEGYELEVLVQSRRNKKAALRLLKKLLKHCRYSPRVMITDKLKSYGAAKKEVMPDVEHRQHKGLNNRAENSHQPTRQKEKQMRGFKSHKHIQRILYIIGQVRNLFYNGGRYKNLAATRRKLLNRSLYFWDNLVSQDYCI
jgi:putative transposase